MVCKLILFISFSKRNNDYFNDPSARYRCIFPAESLRDQGANVCVTHISQVNQEQLLDADVIIFHRPSLTSKLSQVINWAKQSGKRCVADFDDLLFAPDESAHSAAVESRALSDKVARKYAQDYLAALNHFDECIVSTAPLSEWVMRVSDVKKTYVIPNRLPKRWYALTNKVASNTRFENKVLRYLPGTSHHDGDFDIIKPALSRFLCAHPEVTLEVIGPLRFHLSEVNPSQIRHFGAIPFERFAQFMADSWVCIAPLLDTSFNQCKSGLKFWESGLYGVPLVASPLADYQDFDCGGLIQVESTAEWLSGLESLLDWDIYQKASVSAEETARKVLHENSPNLYLELLSNGTQESIQGHFSEKSQILDSNSDIQSLPESKRDIDADLISFPLTISEQLFYKIQQQYFYAWLGPGSLAYLLKPRHGITINEMPGVAAEKKDQLAMLKSLWLEEHPASQLIGRWQSSEADNYQEGQAVLNRTGFTCQSLPELPVIISQNMKTSYDSWDMWLEDLSVANQKVWKDSSAPSGNRLLRKIRKFRRSPKHFLEDSKFSVLNMLAKLIK